MCGRKCITRGNLFPQECKMGCAMAASALLLDATTSVPNVSTLGGSTDPYTDEMMSRSTTITVPSPESCQSGYYGKGPSCIKCSSSRPHSDAGSNMDSSFCYACARNFYGISASNCQMCPAGKMAPVGGAMFLSSCVPISISPSTDRATASATVTTVTSTLLTTYTAKTTSIRPTAITTNITTSTLSSSFVDTVSTTSTNIRSSVSTTTSPFTSARSTDSTLPLPIGDSFVANSHGHASLALLISALVVLLLGILVWYRRKVKYHRWLARHLPDGDISNEQGASSEISTGLTRSDTSVNPVFQELLSNEYHDQQPLTRSNSEEQAHPHGISPNNPFSLVSAVTDHDDFILDQKSPSSSEFPMTCIMEASEEDQSQSSVSDDDGSRSIGVRSYESTLYAADEAESYDGDSVSKNQLLCADSRTVYISPVTSSVI